jgi:hypothetical protein
MEADNWRISENLHDGARVIIEARRKARDGRGWKKG